MNNTCLSFIFTLSFIFLLSSCKKEECLSCQLAVPALDYTMPFPEVCGSDEELNAIETDYRQDESIDELIKDGIPYFVNCIRVEQ